MLFLRFLATVLALAGVNGVGIILVDARGRFLLNLRGRRSSKPDLRQRLARSILARRWAILGGMIDPHETPPQAALRAASRLSPRAPPLRPVLRAFARSAAYQACLRDARPG